MATFGGGALRAAHPPPARTSILSCSRSAAAAEPRRAGARGGGMGGGRGVATAVSRGNKRRKKVSNFFEVSPWHLLRHCPGHDFILLNRHLARRLCLPHDALVHSQPFALQTCKNQINWLNCMLHCTASQWITLRHAIAETRQAMQTENGAFLQPTTPPIPPLFSRSLSPSLSQAARTRGAHMAMNTDGSPPSGARAV